MRGLWRGYFFLTLPPDRAGGEEWPPEDGPREIEGEEKLLGATEREAEYPEAELLKDEPRDDDELPWLEKYR